MSEDQVDAISERERAILEEVGLPRSFRDMHGQVVHFRGENASKPGHFLSLRGTIAALEVNFVDNEDEPPGYTVKLYFSGGASNIHCLRCDSPYPKRWSAHVGVTVADGTIVFY